MATLLGGIELSDDLTLHGLIGSPAAVTTARRTLTGRLLHRTDPLPGGRTLNLQAENHLTRGQLQALRQVMAAGLPVPLVHHLGNFTVLITGLPEEPTINYADPIASDWMSGEITLLEV